MLKIWYSIKGYLAGAVALITCPCHLPLTLPLLITLTAGTVFGGWLADNTLLVAALVTLAFVGSLGLAFGWWGKGTIAVAGPNRGWRKVTLVTSSACDGKCEDARVAWNAAQAQAGFQLEEVDIFSRRGRDLAARHNITTTPAAVVDDRQVIRGTRMPQQG